MYYINVPPQKKKKKKRCNLSSLILIIVYLLLIALELLRGHCNLSESLRFILAINSISNLSKKKKTYMCISGVPLVGIL